MTFNWLKLCFILPIVIMPFLMSIFSAQFESQFHLSDPSTLTSLRPPYKYLSLKYYFMLQVSSVFQILLFFQSVYFIDLLCPKKQINKLL